MRCEIINLILEYEYAIQIKPQPNAIPKHYSSQCNAKHQSSNKCRCTVNIVDSLPYQHHFCRPFLQLDFFLSLQQHAVLSRVGFLDISLGHLLHHKVAIDLHILNQLSISHPPFARNGEDADWRFGIDETVDAIRGVCEGQAVCCLHHSLVLQWHLLIHTCICMAGRGVVAYLTNGFLVCYTVCRLAVRVAGLEVVTYECWAQGFYHEIVVVQSGEDSGGGRAADGGGDVCGCHCGVGFGVEGWY
jgi:hypothetical protein